MITGKESIYPQIDTDVEFADVSNEKQYGRTYNHTEGMNLRQLFATNAQSAIISNADTMREITNKVSGKRGEGQEAAFFKVVSSIAVLHADALIEALNK